jgi:hypothetical protein
MKLIDLAKILRSKNAGPLYITFDLIFDSREKMLLAEGSLIKEIIARAYGAQEKYVDIITYEVVNSIKITMPRKHISGSIYDDDIYGCQQHIPLGNIEIETEA